MSRRDIRTGADSSSVTSFIEQLWGGSAVVEQLPEVDPLADFQEVLKPAASRRPWSKPITFVPTRPESPFQTIVTVDEHASTNVSPAQQWTAYPFVSGITTPAIEVTNPDTTVTLIAPRPWLRSRRIY